MSEVMSKNVAKLIAILATFSWTGHNQATLDFSGIADVTWTYRYWALPAGRYSHRLAVKDKVRLSNHRAEFRVRPRGLCSS